MIRHIHTHNDECASGSREGGAEGKEKALLMRAHMYNGGFFSKFHNWVFFTVCSGLVQ